jgi:aspartate/methionine/tyrosine aminotransferase
MKSGNRLLSSSGTTIFSVMSALALQHGAINLGQGFPDTEGPADLIAAAAAALRDHRNQYPPLTGLPELREAVARANARFHGLHIDPETEVVVTSGATEALAASLAALLDPGDEVVVIEPLYDTYLPVIRLLGAIPRLVRLEPPDWSLPHAALAAAFGPRTKAILLNTPMNPTGKVYTAQELGVIAGLMAKYDTYAICDEVYEHLVFLGARHIPLMTLPGMRDRCIRIGSAGKTFALTGWKIGYVSAPAPLATLVARAHQNLTFTSPPNLQRAVALGLAKSDVYFITLADNLQAQRDLLAGGLAALGFQVLPCQGTYFLTVAYGALSNESAAKFCRRMVTEARVAAIPVSAFYDENPPEGYVRFAFCKRPEVLSEALFRLKSWVGPNPASSCRDVASADTGIVL